MRSPIPKRRLHASTVPAFLALWTATQIADLTGLSKHRVYALTRRGLIPCVRVGRTVRYDPAAIKSWLAEGGAAVPPAADTKVQDWIEESAMRRATPSAGGSVSRGA